MKPRRDKKYKNVCADLKDRAAKGSEGDADRLMADNCLECLAKWQSSWYRNYFISINRVYLFW